MEKRKFYKEESKKQWNTSDRPFDQDDIKLGAILRIADAVELMAKNHLNLQSNLTYQTSRANGLDSDLKIMKRSYAALKGQITKLKKKMSEKK